MTLVAHEPNDLTADEAAALEELVFLLTPGPKTLQQIGDRLGMSREHVHLIEERAMLKIRRRVDRAEWERTAIQSQESNVVLRR